VLACRCRDGDTGGMVGVRHVGALALFLFSVPLAVHADTSSLVWGGAPNGPAQIVMVEGGTYEVPLETPAPIYFTPPTVGPDSGFLVLPRADLYRIDDAGERELVEGIRFHQEFDDPEDPDDGDALFAWPSTGAYELDVLAFTPPPALNFEDALMRWLARLFFADVAYAQSFTPIVLEVVHFTIEDVAESVPEPVIIIPGILGSEQHNGEWVIDPILHTYDDLIATLDANGYTPDIDLFPFPYNWRKSNVETALLLKEKIDEVKGICDCDKVDLVAHSMGGLVARQYIQSDAYEGDVDQLIFLGTPHLGAPKAYPIWEAGEYVPGLLPIEDKVLERMLNQEAREQGYTDLFTYIRTKPILSVKELLPTYDYIFDGNVLRSYPANYPRNIFLEVLNSGVGDLLNSGVSIFNIIGETGTNETVIGIQSTNPAAFLPKWQNGYPDGFSDNFGDHGLIRGQGDATVPTASAAYITQNLQTISSEHTEIPSNAEGNVYKILTAKDADTLVHNINLPDAKLLFFKMFSPADMLVIAPDGSKIGKDFNGQEVNGIPNAFYTGFTTDTEFITILNPLDGEYKIYTQGTGSGPYTVEINLISDATTTDTAFTGNTGPGITSQLNLDVEEGAIEQSSLEAVVTYANTLADLERIYALKWVNIGIYKSLKTQLQTAKKARPVVAKALLQAMLKQLSAYRGKLVTEQGYQILKTDIERLLAL